METFLPKVSNKELKGFINAHSDIRFSCIFEWMLPSFDGDSFCNKGIRPHSSNTHMRCKECSAHLGKDMYLCNGFIKGAPVNCRRHYHIYNHNKEFALTMIMN